MNFKLPSDYNDVAARIGDLRDKHPQASLQQVALDFREVAGQSWVIYTAACYRTPDDERPGIGTAWEPVPGRTQFTRDSEVQNAETSAWGRAIVAALAADTKKGVASAEEVRNAQARQTERESRSPAEQARIDLAALCAERGLDRARVAEDFAQEYTVPIVDGDETQVRAFTDKIREGTVT